MDSSAWRDSSIAWLNGEIIERGLAVALFHVRTVICYQWPCSCESVGAAETAYSHA